jgi:hypothetical protein
MSSSVKCHCQSCNIRSLTGPALIITFGVLLLLHEARGGDFYFGNTWPVLLVVLGILHLASSFASRDGHIEPPPPIQPGAVPPSVPPAGSVPPPPPFPPQGQ